VSRMTAAARRLFPRVPVCQADSGQLPFSDDSFDVVLLRHVLEHLPPWLMQAVLAEATRVARRAVVMVFHLPPEHGRSRQSRGIGADFIETQWAESDVLSPFVGAGWNVRERFA